MSALVTGGAQLASAATRRLDRRLYATRRIDKQLAKAFVERHHYLHSFVAERLSWGLYQGDELVGVSVFGVPSNQAVLTNVFPDPEPSLNHSAISTRSCCTPRRRPVGLPSCPRIHPIVAVVAATMTRAGAVQLKAAVRQSVGELPTASMWCQRWCGRRSWWRRPKDGVR